MVVVVVSWHFFPFFFFSIYRFVFLFLIVLCIIYIFICVCIGLVWSELTLKTKCNWIVYHHLLFHSYLTTNWAFLSQQIWIRAQLSLRWISCSLYSFIHIAYFRKFSVWFRFSFTHLLWYIVSIRHIFIDVRVICIAWKALVFLFAHTQNNDKEKLSCTRNAIFAHKSKRVRFSMFMFGYFFLCACAFVCACESSCGVTMATQLGLIDYMLI